MTVDILYTKLFIPPLRSNLVSRPRLIDLLQSGSTAKLTLISAPAGYGKTSLLSEWIDLSGIPSAWVSLDQQDNDLNRFWTYIIEGLKSINLEVNEQVSSFLGSQQPGNIQAFLISFLNQISETNWRFTLVLDDYHLIQNQDIHEALNFFIDNLPPKTHLVIATRTDPPLRLAQLRPGGQLCEIRADHLRFTNEETLQFLNDSMGLDLSAQEVSSLSGKTEGWIVGLQLAAFSLQGHYDKRSFIRAFAGDDRNIADYLLDEALIYQPPHIQDFLLKTSILDQLSGSLCDALTCQNNSQKILENLERANLFITPLDNQRNWFRYHHLFADLLNIRLKMNTPSIVPQLHQRASKWYDREGMLNLAVMHAIKADDIKRLEELVQANTLAILENGATALLERQLRLLPPGKVQGNLWVLLARAWSGIFSGRVTSVEDTLIEVENALSDSQHNPNEFKKAEGHIAAIRACVADLCGLPEQCKAYAKQAIEKLSEEDNLTVSFAWMMLATGLLRTREISEAEFALQEGLVACKPYPHSYIMIGLLGMQSKIPFLRGRPDQSAAILKMALDLARQRSPSGAQKLPVIGLVHLYMSEILYEWNRLEEARYQIDRGIELLEAWGDADRIILGLLTAVKIYDTLGDGQRVFHLINKARLISEESPYWLERIVALENWLRVKNLDGFVISPWLRKHKALSEAEFKLEDELLYRCLVRIFLLQKKYDQADFVITKMTPAIEASESIDQRIRILVLKAAALSGLRKGDAALQTLQSALDCAAQGGYIRVFLDESEHLIPLLFQAATRGIQPAYCRKILDEAEKWEKVPVKSPHKQSPSGGEEWIEALSDREIEVLRHIAQGCTNQEIAQELVLSLYTVKSHARNIYSKLGVKNRTEAVAKARLLGMLSKE